MHVDPGDPGDPGRAVHDSVQLPGSLITHTHSDAGTGGATWTHVDMHTALARFQQVSCPSPLHRPSSPSIVHNVGFSSMLGLIAVGKYEYPYLYIKPHVAEVVAVVALAEGQDISWDQPQHVQQVSHTSSRLHVRYLLRAVQQLWPIRSWMFAVLWHVAGCQGGRGGGGLRVTSTPFANSVAKAS